MEQIKLKTKKILIIIISLILMMSELLIYKDAQAGNTAYIDIGGEVWYAGMVNRWIKADNAIAYCVQPQQEAPSNGDYTKLNILDSDIPRKYELRADLWFSYGGPGFDKNIWPETYFDGSKLDPEKDGEKLYNLAHVLMADTFSSDGNKALYGTNEEFKTWVRYNILGFSSTGEIINDNAVGRKIWKRHDEIPYYFDAFIINWGDANTQTIASFVELGSLEISKISSRPEISKNNISYSLDGAEYGIYTSPNDNNELASFRTDASGHGFIKNLPPWNLYLKEKKAPLGMALNNTTYHFTITSGANSYIEKDKIYDIPQMSSVDLLLKKVDATTKKPMPQGAAKLANAEYQIDYYSGYFDNLNDAKASGQPKATWIFKTDKKGEIHYNSSYLVSGSPLYTLSDNKTPAIPLGTILYKEIKAPEGYNLNTLEKCLTIYGNESINENCNNYNTQIMEDTVKRGNYHLFKEAPINYNEEETLVPIPNVMFQIINKNKGNVVSPDNLHEVKNNQLVTTITTNYNSIADTKDKTPENWTACLAYGTYQIHEVIPDSVRAEFKEKYGVTLIEIPDWEINIKNEEQYDAITIVKDKIPSTPVLINKLDSETGKPIMLPCTFEIFKQTETGYKKITYLDRMTSSEVSSWTTINGKILLPFKLEEGDYKITETKAPEGYTINNEAISFTINKYFYWNEPININMENTPVHIIIDADKIDTEGAFVPCAEYELYANGNIVTGDGTIRNENNSYIAHAYTDKNGHFSLDKPDQISNSKFPFLYPGNYKLCETKNPDGYALNTEEQNICVKPEGQNIAIVKHRVKLIENISSLKIIKTDSFDETKRLSGAKFHLWNVNDKSKMKLETDINGEVVVQYLPCGKYCLEEIEAPKYYFISNEESIFEFEVDEQGLVCYNNTKQPNLELKLKNTPINIEILKIDEERERPLGYADLILKDTNGTILKKWTSSFEPEVFTGLLPGSYILEEIKAPEGYEIANNMKFEVFESPDRQTIKFKNKLLHNELQVRKNETFAASNTPKTGDTFIIIIAISSLLILVSSIYLKLLEKRKHKKILKLLKV